MTRIELAPSALSHHEWHVRQDRRVVGSFDSAIEALLHARQLYQQLPADRGSVLVVCFDGEHETRLAERPPAAD